MESNPQISVIVPVYKVEPYLRQCIDSILSQTFADFELILVDDGSPDNCGMICDEYAAKDRRIKVSHKANGGQSSARNAGLDIASGEWISFVDSDDYIHPQMLEILHQNVNNDDSTISACCYRKVTDSDDPSFGEFRTSQKTTALSSTAFMEYGMSDRVLQACVWNKLYSRKLFSDGLRFIEGMTHEDIMMSCQLILKAKKVVLTSEKLYYYRIRPGSTMTNSSKEFAMEALNAYIFEIEYFKKHHFRELWMKQSRYRLDQIVFQYEDFKIRHPDQEMLKMILSKYRTVYWLAFLFLSGKEKIDRFIYFLSPTICNRLHHRSI